MTAVPPRFRPAPYGHEGALRTDAAADFAHVIGLVSLPGTGVARTELVVGIDAGHVIRAIPRSEAGGLPPRAAAQLAFHLANGGGVIRVETRALYLLDVQVLEHAPDEPGANDPLYLYGVLRGPYPDGLAAGVRGIEGQLATTRVDVLAGLTRALPTAFRYAADAHCIPAIVAGGDLSRGDAIVLAYALPPPLGSFDVIANDREVAQVFHDVMGALRRDLGDDLATDPVPVPDRAAYERELVAGGWQISGAVAKRKSKGRLASLFSPAAVQQLPREATLAIYAALVPPLLMRVPGGPTPDAQQVAARTRPAAPPPPPPPPPPRKRPPGAPMSPIDFLGWIQETVASHHVPGTKAPRVTTPTRNVSPSPLPAWMFDLSDDDDD